MSSAVMPKVSVARISATFYYTPLWIALNRQMFHARGLEVEIEEIGDGAVATARLRDRTLDITIAPPDGVIADSVAGGPLRVVAGNTSGLSHCVMALEKFKRIEDLRGARIGVISMTEGSTFHFQEIASRFGLHFPGDYILDPVGGAPTRHKLLLERKIDAGLQSIPFTYMEEEAGLSNLGTAKDYVPDYQFNSINANARWAAENPDVLTSFLAVMVEATRLMHGDRSLSAQIATREMNVPLRYTERAWDDFMTMKIMPADLSVSEKGLLKVAELMQKAGVIPEGVNVQPSRYVDLRYLERARKIAE